MKSTVIVFPGSNCDRDVKVALEKASGSKVDMVWHGETSFADSDLIVLPGGFSYGDYLRPGAMAAKSPVMSHVIKRARAGVAVLGICNGFQILVKMGLLPNIGGSLDQEVTLGPNQSGRFEDRWVRCRATQPCRSPFLRSISMIDLPVRHGEGRLIIRDTSIRKTIVDRGLVALAYCDATGIPTDQYPDNPNGSSLACAALTDLSGQVLGMMPHPEAYLSFYNHPNWGRRIRAPHHEEGQGLSIFRNIVEHIEQ